MSTVQEIEAAIVRLKPDEIEEIARWFAERREESWDRQLEADAKAGRLDHIIAKAKADARAGKSAPFP
jgi:hypothetical protein